jgi:beta-lactam-binding protein with PASTA domain
MPIDIFVGQVTIPDLLGLDEAVAVTLLDDIAIAPIVVRVYSEDAVEGTVLAQSIEAGTEVDPGTGMRIDVASLQRRRNMVTSRRTLLRVIRG